MLNSFELQEASRLLFVSKFLEQAVRLFSCAVKLGLVLFYRRQKSDYKVPLCCLKQKMPQAFLFLAGCVSHHFSMWAQMFSVAVDCVSQDNLCCTSKENCCKIKECRFILMCHEHMKKKDIKFLYLNTSLVCGIGTVNDFSFNKSLFC